MAERGSYADQEPDVEESVQALSLIYGCIPPMLARVACELGVPDILQAAGEPLSALQIAERIETLSAQASQPALNEAANRLERVMRCLSAHGVFKVHVEDESAARSPSLIEGVDGGAATVDKVHEGLEKDHVACQCTSKLHAVIDNVQNIGLHADARSSIRVDATRDTVDGPAKYSLNAVSRWLLQWPRVSTKGSFRALLMFLSSPAVMMTWHPITDNILQGGDPEPFERAHGMPLWKYAHTHPDFSALLNNAMSSDTLSLQALLTHYGGFEGVHTLVDVGGGVGTAASHIASSYPSLKVICFDLPHVLAAAPSHPGVEFVAGDMFESIPRGDAIFLKWILHDWSDEDCIRILSNCHKVLPKHGKIIIMDAVMENFGEQKHPFYKIKTLLDIAMLAGTKGGKERTQGQWESILKFTKFGRYNIFKLPCAQWIIEAFPTLETLSHA